MKIADLNEHLEKVKLHLQDELVKVRTGRANASVLDPVKVEAYSGSPAMEIKEVATVTIPDSQSILISPWDKSLLGKIEEAIRKADLGLNPINEGESIRVPIPALTEERRKEMVKNVGQYVEQAKISVRTIRQNAIKAVEEMEDTGTITEDEMYSQKKQIEERISQINLELEGLGKLKEKELMSI